MKKLIIKLSLKIAKFIVAIMMGLTISHQHNQILAQETIDVGETGWKVKRPVMASACDAGCPWGELGDFVKESMEPFGYSVILCRNCNRAYGPRLVSENDYPPPLDEENLKIGTNVRVNARVDFGVTSSAMLNNAYNGTLGNAKPQRNLRLIARIEDPFYFLLAARKESGITNIAQIRQKKLPVRIFSSDAGMSIVLNYYGITPYDIELWGGKMGVSVDEALKGDFDIIVGFLASPSLNPESSYWTTLSEKFNLYFIELPEDLLDQIAKQNVDAEHVVAHNCLLRGIDRRIKTLGRSGESIFAREDTPDQAAYDLAKAIYENRGSLKWYIRVYFYDSSTVWQNFGVPLHPGAERYYREVGFIKD
jgi:TRAP transporter TAXI family solute receptor